MNNLELLESAVKITNLRIKRKEDHAFIVWNELGEPRYWNPLKDDGDAFRLAMYLPFLHVSIKRELPSQDFIIYLTFSEYHDPIEARSKIKIEAMRKAIVYAAAEIGKYMKYNEKT